MIYLTNCFFLLFILNLNHLKMLFQVHQGVTLVKIKGKTHRIKTPVCTALKKLQSPVAAAPIDTQSKTSVPDKIVMELTPSCNADFLRVQSVAHNPRIRICSDSSSPLSSIISFLTKKWKPRSIFDTESSCEVCLDLF